MKSEVEPLMKDTLEKTLHLGLIPDGARRWARKRKVGYRAAYFAMVDNLALLIGHYFNRGGKSLSVYLLSSANLSRPRNQLKSVFESQTYFLSTLLPPIAKKHVLQVIHVGSARRLPASYSELLVDLGKETGTPPEHRLYLLVDYDPFDELRSALARSPDGAVDRSSLWVTEPVDLVIRTGGENRLSNFLPLQSGYAELHVNDHYFNDFRPEHLEKEIALFSQRQRRFGL